MKCEIQWIDPQVAMPPTGIVVLTWAECECGPGLYLGGLDPNEGWIEYPGLERMTVYKWTPIHGPSGEIETLYQEKSDDD